MNNLEFVRRPWLAGWLALGLIGSSWNGLTADAAPEDGKLCVMTFNLRYASSQKPNAWPDRRPVMADCIRALAPDLIGTQEGLYGQLKDLAADLPDYEWIGLGREGGSRGEFMAVFYRRTRFEPLEYDHFWLSDTPEVVGSTTWGNRNRRMATWVKFKDRTSGQAFYFLNTHLDHEVQLAREKGAALIRQRTGTWDASLPALIVGDFNATAGANPAYDVLVRDGGFADLYVDAAQKRGVQVRSFHNFKGPQAGDDRIDWILGRGPLKADATEIVTYSRDGQFPSDHFPVVVWLRWAAK